ncbi:MAG: polysaccharide biosynthesis protein, partial [Rhodocyclaceae bacterium]|nr:polysaccharide biosynthesis protein [Rhodocyclaceae bacterium]
MQAISDLALPILAMPRPAKRVVVFLVDASLCVLCLWLALYLRLGEFVALSGNTLIAAGASIILALPIFVMCGLYRAIFRYSGWPALMSVVRAAGIYGLVYAAVYTAIGVVDVPRTVGLIQPMLLLLTVGCTRALARLWLGGHYERELKLAALPKALIYGAGAAGRQLADAMANSYELRLVGFLDDDERLHGHVLDGLPIYGAADLSGLVATLNVSTVLLAIPSLDRVRRNAIIALMRRAKVSVRTLPGRVELVGDRVGATDLRDLDIDDLLGREVVAPNHLLLARNVTDRVVMVTGAGGSIGSELCRQIALLGPQCLLLVEQSEFALYSIHQELEEKLAGRELRLIPLLASVQDAARMSQILSAWRPHTLYHAAAYKHVPMVEHNPAEGLRNNVFGTLCTARNAAEYGVADFVLVSTDKAVRPTNVMGASKRLAEMCLQALAQRTATTRFAIVRFGNVLGSSGSVAPKFRQQIRNGGPLTLTHADVTRYFMTIPEAAQLVIQAGAMSRGGDLFMLDMGEPVRIMDLARRMIELSGFSVRDQQNPDGDIAIEITGLRPGEKLYEELLISADPRPTSHPRIMIAHETCLPWDELMPALQALDAALAANDAG